MDLEKLFAVTTATHRATSRSYMVVGTARISSSRPLNEGDTVVVYRRSDGELHAREEAEFNDGRFKIETHKLPEGIGFDPLKWGSDRSKEAAWGRLRYAYVFQQQFVPDQTALVWRADLGMFRHELIRLRALADINRVEIEKLKAALEIVTHKNKTAIDALLGLLNMNCIPPSKERSYAEHVIDIN